MTASVIFYLILALIGGAIGYITRLPVGVVLGSMFAVGLAKYFDILHLERTVSISFVIQVLLGAMLGLSLIKINKQQLITLGKSLAVVVVIVVIFTGVAGATLGWMTGTNPVLATLAGIAWCHCGSCDISAGIGLGCTDCCTRSSCARCRHYESVSNFIETSNAIEKERGGSQWISGFL